MSITLRAWRRAKARCEALKKDKKGATAVEFALIALPFFFMLFAILEVTMVFFISTSLENATMEAARLIRTGQIQISGGSGEDFRDEVCDGISTLVPCAGRVYVDVRVFEDFDSVSNDSPVDAGDFDDSGLEQNFGEAGDIVLVRVYYVWDVITPYLGGGLSNLNGGKRLIVASTAFRNEPFGEV